MFVRCACILLVDSVSEFFWAFSTSRQYFDFALLHDFHMFFFRCYCSRCLLSLFCFVQKVCKWLHNTRYSYTFCIFLIILCFFSLKSNIAYQKLNNLSHILFYFTVVVNVAIFVISILLFSCHTSLLYLSFIRRTRFFFVREQRNWDEKSEIAFLYFIFIFINVPFFRCEKKR